MKRMPASSEGVNMDELTHQEHAELAAEQDADIYEENARLRDLTADLRERLFASEARVKALEAERFKLLQVVGPDDECELGVVITLPSGAAAAFFAPQGTVRAEVLVELRVLLASPTSPAEPLIKYEYGIRSKMSIQPDKGYPEIEARGRADKFPNLYVLVRRTAPGEWETSPAEPGITLEVLADGNQPIRDYMCSVHRTLYGTEGLRPFDNCIVCIRNERDELRKAAESGTASREAVV